MKKLISVLLCCTLALSLAACGGTDTAGADDIVVKAEDFAQFTGPTIDAIKEAGALTLATEAQYPPFEFIDAKGGFVGCDIWLGKQIAAALGVELKVTDMAFDSIVPSVKSGQADIGIAAITVSEERAKVIDFSKVYQQDVQKLVVSAENKDAFTTKEDLAGKTIGAQRGTVQSTIIQNVLTDSTLFELDKWPTLAMEVAAGKIDGIVVDAPVGENMVAGNDKLAISGFEFSKDEVDIGKAAVVQKGQEDLLALVDAVIEQVEGEQFNAAYDKAVALSKDMGL